MERFLFLISRLGPAYIHRRTNGEWRAEETDGELSIR